MTVKDQRYLGEEEFIDRIEKYKESRESVVYEIPIEVIAREVSKASGVALDRLYSLTRERPRGLMAGGWWLIWQEYWRARA